MGVIVDVLEHIFYFISSLIYQLIIDVYNVFERLCNSRILDSSTIQAIADRMALLLGLIMLFIVMISVVQMVLNPDLVSDKEKGAGNIIKKVILVIVMLGISNFAFRTLYEVQNIVIKSNIVAKLLLANEVNTDNFGGVLSSELFMAFYHVNPRFLNNEGELISDEKDVKQCYDDLNTLKDNIVKGEGFNTGKDCIDLEVKEHGEKHSVVNFNIILSVGVGAVALWFLFNYCITIGIRTVQLAFLEIIAPMAIISYLAPKKETMFEKWWKLYFATYIDVFIRMAIIYFIVFLIATIFENGGSWAFWNSVGKQDFWSDTFITVIMIMALLMFGKKAPDLLKKLFPASASGLGYGARSMKNLFGDMLGGDLVKAGAKMATAGAAIGLVGSLMSAKSRFQINKKNGRRTGQALLGAAGGAVTGFTRGVVAGNQKGNVFGVISKGLKNQRSIDDKYDELITSGGSTAGKFFAGASSFIGETKGQFFTRVLSNLDKIDKYKKDMNTAADEISFVKSAKDAWEKVVQWENEPLESYEARKKEAYSRYKSLQKAAIDTIIIAENGNPKKPEEQEKAKKILNGEIALEIKEDVKDANGNVLMENGEKVTRTVQSVMFDAKDGASSDDLIYASDVITSIKQADSFAKSHNVQYYDKETNTYIKLETIKDRSSLGEASKKAHITKTAITSMEEYQAAIADDKAAGVNSGGSKK